jgi:hypothetical protein
VSISDDESRMTPDGSTARPGPEHTPELPYVADPEEAAFQRRWGPWRPWSPEQVALMLVGLDRPWCVAGGWALDAFTRTSREHEDIDVAVFRSDIPAFHRYLGQEWHCWAVGSRMMRPLDADDPDLPEWADQCWVRRHSWSPWVADVLAGPDLDGDWVFRRDPTVVLPFDEAIWERAGVRYLRPEIVLAYKAKLARPKDDADLARAWPLLDTSRRTWLLDAVARLHPDHPWLAR